MSKKAETPWQEKIITPDRVLDEIRPGMRIFLGTGAAEPRTLVKHLLAANKGNLADLELIQLISLGEAIAIDERCYRKYRLRTFFAGWVASEAITAGRVDLIPCRFSRVPELIASGVIQVDVAFVQITPPDAAGYASLGTAVDVARQAIERATLVVGEINHQVARTMGDSYVHLSEFDYLVESDEPPIFLPRWKVDQVFDKVAENVASLIEDGDTICYTFGPLFEGLSIHLARKRNLGVHGIFFTDALMDLTKAGAINNKYKKIYRGKSLTSYAFGTPELMKWLDRNPLVEFQGIDIVGDARLIGRNDHFMSVIPARKVDLTGNVALHTGKGNVAASLGAAQELVAGAGFSQGGRTIFGLPSRNLKRESNILFSLHNLPNQLTVNESIDFVVTEYGVAHLAGRTIRERALALIDIAHPDYRAALVKEAKEANILYADQIYLAESGYLYPEKLNSKATFKGDVTLRFRAIRPSDEEEMRRLFYRFSDEAVYYRYFSPIKTMPHSRMQEYVNVDYRNVISLVGLVGEPGAGHIVAEARLARLPDKPYGDTAFLVDEEYHNRGIATYLLNAIIRIAQEWGLRGITADVLPHNKSMWHVYEKTPYTLKAERTPDSYHLTITFDECKVPDAADCRIPVK